VAPSARDLDRNGALRLSRRDDDDRKHQQGQGDRTGEDHTATQPDGQRQARGEHAVHDGGDGREVLQVQLDQLVVPAPRVGELLQVDSGSNTQGNGQQGREADDPQRPEDRRPSTGRLGEHLGGVVGEEVRVETVHTVEERRHQQCGQAGHGEEQGDPQRDQEGDGRAAALGVLLRPQRTSGDGADGGHQ
jgi:hypothetical protein